MIPHFFNRVFCFMGVSIFSAIAKGLFALLVFTGAFTAKEKGAWAQTVDFKTYLQGVNAEILRHKKIIRQDPLDAISYFELGKAYLALGRHKDEVVAYKEAIQLDPKYTAAHYNLSMAYDLLKDGSNAIKHMLRALDLYSQRRNHRQIRAAQRQLKNLHLKYPGLTKGTEKTKRFSPS